MASDAHVATLRELELLQPLSESLRADLVDLLVRESDSSIAPSGTVLYSEGETADGSGMLLVAGTVEVERTGEEPVVVEAPALLGEMYQFNPHALRTATVTVLDSATVLEFSWPRFNHRAKVALSNADQNRFVLAVEEYAFERIPDVPLLDLPGFSALPRRTLLRISMALFWIGERQYRVDGELLLAEGTPTRGEGYVLLSGRLALVRSGQALEVLRAPALLGHIVRDPAALHWRRTVRVAGGAETLRIVWPDYIAYLETVLPRETVEEALHVMSGAVDTRC